MESVTIVFMIADVTKPWTSSTQFISLFGKDSISNFGDTEASLIDALVIRYTNDLELGSSKKLPYIIVNLLNHPLDKFSKSCENLIERLGSKLPFHFIERLVIITTNPILVNQSRNLYLMDTHFLKSLGNNYYGVDLSIICQDLLQVKILPEKVTNLVDQFYRDIQNQDTSTAESYLKDLELLNPNITELPRMRKCLEKVNSKQQNYKNQPIKSPLDRQDAIIELSCDKLCKMIEEKLDKGEYTTNIVSLKNACERRYHLYLSSIGSSTMIEGNTLKNVTKLYLEAGWTELSFSYGPSHSTSTTKQLIITLTNRVII